MALRLTHDVSIAALKQFLQHDVECLFHYQLNAIYLQSK